MRLLEAILHFKLKNPKWKTENTWADILFSCPRLGRTPCNGKGKRKGAMWAGMILASGGPQALSMPDISVTISCEMSETCATSACHLVSIPGSGAHCLD